jgi:hypothetical protein
MIPRSIVAIITMATVSLSFAGAQPDGQEPLPLELFGGDMLMSQEQILEVFGPEVAADAPRMFKLRPPDALEIEHMDVRASFESDTSDRRLGAPNYDSGRVWKYGRVFYHLDVNNILPEQVRIRVKDLKWRP